MSLVILAGADEQSVFSQPPLAVFSPQVLDFCQALSSRLLRHAQAKRHPELAALGFWLRKANIKQMQQAFLQQDGLLLKPLGTVVHFTPANVDGMFVYSWICSLLMGNNNLVRVSSQDSEVKVILLAMLTELLADPEFSELGLRNGFVSYPRQSSVTSALSLNADARVIWGGDETVNAIRALPCKPRCRDIAFADRYSVALVNGDALSQGKLEKLAELLWRDIHPFSQMACSSPRVLFWLGDDSRQDALWHLLKEQAETDPIAIGQRTAHLVTSQLLQASGKSNAPSTLGSVSLVPVSHLTEQILDWHPGQNLLYLLKLDSLERLKDSLTEKCQTLSYWGLDKEELLRFFSESSITGVDRIVPIGRALDFSPVWDGYRLFSQLSRTLVVI